MFPETCVALPYAKTSYSGCIPCFPGHIFVLWVYMSRPQGFPEIIEVGEGGALEGEVPHLCNQRVRARGQDKVIKNTKRTSFVFWLVESAAHWADTYQSCFFTALDPMRCYSATGPEASLLSQVSFSSFRIYCLGG